MAGREDVALAVLTDQKVHSDRNKLKSAGTLGLSGVVVITKRYNITLWIEKPLHKTAITQTNLKRPQTPPDELKVQLKLPSQL